MIRVLFAPLAALLLVLVPAQPAAAADPGLDFSVDGATWSPMPMALLPEPPVLTPGERVAPTIEVRSTRDEPMTLVVAIVRPRASAPAAGAAFSLAAQDVQGRELLEPTRFEQLGECTVLLSQAILPGETAAVTVVVALDATVTGTEAQGSSVGFHLRVGRAAGVAHEGCPTDAVDIAFVPPGTGASVGNTLPRTGAPLTPWLVVVATATMVLGAALIAVRRRREDRS